MCRGCRKVVKTGWQVVRPWMGSFHEPIHESQTQIHELRQIPPAVWAAQDSDPRPGNQCDRSAGTTPQIKVKAQTGWYVQYKNDSLRC